MQPTTLNPQQVKQMQMIVKQSLEQLLDDQNAEFIVKKAKAGDPKAAVLEAVAPVIKAIYVTAEEAGAKVDMVVVLSAGIQVIAMMAKMLESQGILKEADIPAFSADVSKMAVAAHNAEIPQPIQPTGMMQGVPA